MKKGYINTIACTALGVAVFCSVSAGAYAQATASTPVPNCKKEQRAVDKATKAATKAETKLPKVQGQADKKYQKVSDRLASLEKELAKATEALPLAEKRAACDKARKESTDGVSAAPECSNDAVQRAPTVAAAKAQVNTFTKRVEKVQKALEREGKRRTDKIAKAQGAIEKTSKAKADASSKLESCKTGGSAA